MRNRTSGTEVHEGALARQTSSEGRPPSIAPVERAEQAFVTEKAAAAVARPSSSSSSRGRHRQARGVVVVMGRGARQPPGRGLGRGGGKRAARRLAHSDRGARRLVSGGWSEGGRRSARASTALGWQAQVGGRASRRPAGRPGAHVRVCFVFCISEFFLFGRHRKGQEGWSRRGCCPQVEARSRWIRQEKARRREELEWRNRSGWIDGS
jgi:hypothetical protein